MPHMHCIDIVTVVAVVVVSVVAALVVVEMVVVEVLNVAAAPSEVSFFHGKVTDRSRCGNKEVKGGQMGTEMRQTGVSMRTRARVKR